MNNEDLIELFKKFLRSHHAWAEFNKQTDAVDETIDTESFLKKAPPETYITLAFNWKGSKYNWNRLDDLWRDKLYDYQKKTFEVW